MKNARWIGSVASLQSGRIHVHRRQILQCSKIVPYLCVIAPQELVGCSGHVDVEGLALRAFTVEKQEHRFILGRAFQVDSHDIEQGLAEIGRAAFGGFVAPDIFLARLVGHGVNPGEGNQRLLPSKAAHIANLCHELRPK